MKKLKLAFAGLWLALCLTSTFVFAQTEITVSGRVKDEKGNPVTGATVSVKGGSGGTSTDADGRFTLRVPRRGVVLVFSSVGYDQQEMKAGSGLVEVTLAQGGRQLDDVVVVGYGTQKRVSMTSAVASIAGKDLTTRPISSLEQALQGKLPGLTILDKGGQPGNSNTPIVLRGVNTLYTSEDLSGASVAPLVLIDGVEQPFSNVNPDDIDNISVLKDASSTAIYGSRASNGVILITTKRAKSGKALVTYSGYYGRQRSVSQPKPMDLASYLRLENTAYKNVGSTPPKPYRDQDIDAYIQGNKTDPIHYPLPYDWYSRAFHSAGQTNHTVSISGGSDNFKGRASVRFQDQDGILDNTNSKLAEARVNTDLRVSSKINVSMDIDYRYENDRNPYGLANILQFMTQNAIWTVPRYPNGDYGGGTQGNNPLLLIDKGGYNHQESGYFIGNLKGVWQIVKGLTFTTQFASHSTNISGKLYQNTWNTQDSNVVKKSNLHNMLTESRNDNRDYTINNLLDYSKSFGDHGLKVLVGYSQIQYTSHSLSAYRQDFYNNDVQSLSAGANDATKDNSGADAGWGLRSYFGRANYAYKDKYLFEANGRFDGSSRFTGKNQYSFFPSFSAGWRLSQEKFWDGFSDKVNELKLRGSYGKTGNQAVALYSYFPTLSLLTYDFNNLAAQGYIQTTVANQNITWESTTAADVGLDASFLHNRIMLTVDYYKKRTSGILLTLPVPGTLGLQAGPQNAGKVDNTGIEFTLGTRNRFGKFGVDATVNLAINTNKVVDLAGTGPFYYGTDQNPRYTIQEGYPIYSFWGYKTAGFFQSDAEAAAGTFYLRNAKAGDTRYLDLNKDGKIDANDQAYLGNTFPKYTFGGAFSFSYSSFSLNFALQGVGKVSMRMAGAFGQGGNYEGMVPDIYTNNYWTPDNPNAEFARPTKQDLRNQTNNDRLVLDASYLRVKNAQLVYRFPSRWLQKAGIGQASVYVSGTNLLTFSKLNKWHIDPESMSGVQNYYPQISVYSLGFNLSL
ncbi:MAG: TonB-dependent receptor [Bacteroidetes bacterium]|nr:TonB-dependent receptor [Bacteroidota bacterium]